MASAVPRKFALKSQNNSKYLCFNRDNTNKHLNGLLRFSEEEIEFPFRTFEVEPAGSDSRLVHISDGVRFRHVQTQNYACLWRDEDNEKDDAQHSSCLFAGSKDADVKNSWDVFSLVDWENVVILPENVTFKGDNGLYLDAAPQQQSNYLEFRSDDPRIQGCVHEVFLTNTGTVIIKSTQFDRFWTNARNWIRATRVFSYTHPSPRPINSAGLTRNLLFEPVMVGNNQIALRSLENDLFCKRFTNEGKVSCLDAGVSTITREAALEVSEAIISREISNVRYHLGDARIYNQTPLVKGVSFVVNRSPTSTSQTVNFSVTDTTSNTWESSLSLKLGVSMKFKAGIPLIASTTVEVSTEFTGSYTWGETRTTERMLSSSVTVTVPPMSSVRVSMLATQGSCDVPFSYTQRDVLVNGRPVTYQKDDGLYTGVNSYQIDFATDAPQPLS
ncbi:OLC1v1009222C1 [Oldenlandia corymbosa var. corymbosa]|uniref:OLC1v1009222C1 n=1 Tax=Oldenlandia corymbosa var. corymbosa TaxID=529605 RepID=A0AAV1DNF1_OLDCO|nr:OLC1v1009222C1 [Oldenlandia corymbosa var. corymbosa]